MKHWRTMTALFLMLCLASCRKQSDLIEAGNNIRDTDAAAILLDIIDTLQSEQPLIWLHLTEPNENGNILLGKAEGMEIYDAEVPLNHLSDYTYEPITADKIPETESIWLCSDNFTIYGYENLDILQLNADGELYQFRSVPLNDSIPSFGDNLKHWFDETAGSIQDNAT